MLTEYQRAILQEMGIPVVTAREAVADSSCVEDATLVNSTTSVKTASVKTPLEQLTSSVNKKSVIASLRQQASGSNKPQQQINPEPPAKVAIPPSKTRDDIEQALILLEIIQDQPVEWLMETSSKFACKGGTVTLGQLPQTLTADNKKQLWSQLIQHGN